MRSFRRAFTPSCVHSIVHSLRRAFTPSCIDSAVLSLPSTFPLSSIHLVIRSLSRAFTASCVHSVVRSLRRAFIPSCVHSVSTAPMTSGRSFKQNLRRRRRLIDVTADQRRGKINDLPRINYRDPSGRVLPRDA